MKKFLLIFILLITLFGVLFYQYTLNRTPRVELALSGSANETLQLFSKAHILIASSNTQCNKEKTTLTLTPKEKFSPNSIRIDFGWTPNAKYYISKIVYYPKGIFHKELAIPQYKNFISSINQLKTPTFENNELIIETTGNDGFLVLTPDA